MTPGLPVPRRRKGYKTSLLCCWCSKCFSVWFFSFSCWAELLLFFLSLKNILKTLLTIPYQCTDNRKEFMNFFLPEEGNFSLPPLPYGSFRREIARTTTTCHFYDVHNILPSGLKDRKKWVSRLPQCQSWFSSSWSNQIYWSISFRLTDRTTPTKSTQALRWALWFSYTLPQTTFFICPTSNRWAVAVQCHSTIRYCSTIPAIPGYRRRRLPNWIHHEPERAWTIGKWRRADCSTIEDDSDFCCDSCSVPVDSCASFVSPAGPRPPVWPAWRIGKCTWWESIQWSRSWGPETIW